jgi:hypothetical protein
MQFAQIRLRQRRLRLMRRRWKRCGPELAFKNRSAPAAICHLISG